MPYLCFEISEMVQLFTGDSGKPYRTITFNVKLLGPYKGLAYKGLTTEK